MRPCVLCARCYLAGASLPDGLRQNTTLLALSIGFNALGAEATLATIDSLAAAEEGKDGEAGAAGNDTLVELGLENTTGDGKECDRQVQRAFERVRRVVSTRRNFVRVELEFPARARSSVVDKAVAQVGGCIEPAAA